MNKRRLLKLADLLEADARNRKGIKFDLGDWGSSEDDAGCTISCGTSACAMGLAVLSGAFKRAGLTNRYGDKSSRLCPGIGGRTGFGAASELFEIDDYAANFLFSDSHYPDDKKTGAVGERMVAKRIREFVTRDVRVKRVRK